MDEFTVTLDQLQEFTERVREQLPLPADGAGVARTSSSVRMEFVHDGRIKGTGQTTFFFTNGRTVRATWHVLVVGIETWVVVDPEEVE